MTATANTREREDMEKYDNKGEEEDDDNAKEKRGR